MNQRMRWERPANKYGTTHARRKFKLPTPLSCRSPVFGQLPAQLPGQLPSSPFRGAGGNKEVSRSAQLSCSFVMIGGCFAQQATYFCLLATLSYSSSILVFLCPLSLNVHVHSIGGVTANGHGFNPWIAVTLALCILWHTGSPQGNWRR